MINHHAALIYTMVIMSAADRDMYRSKQGLGGLPGHR